jgi:hypothetical protein
LKVNKILVLKKIFKKKIKLLINMVLINGYH